MLKRHYFTPLFLLLGLMSACTQQQWDTFTQAGKPQNKPDAPDSISYVSATPSVPEPQYVSALEEAIAEFDAPDTLLTENNATAAPAPSIVGETAGVLGTPAGGSGVTLLNPAMRSRLNDALKTTPTGGDVKWTAGDLTYSLAPNSPVYTPQHSGGQCRDALLTIYGDGFTNIRKRSLFCQSGPSADWVITLK